MRVLRSPHREAKAATPGIGALRYRPEIDGLRTIAVLPVILFHAGFEWFSGGYVGVDVFFVISGYLITSILVEDLSEGRFSIARFYERRARRILPALFFVLLCTSVAAWLWMLPTQFEEYSRTLLAVIPLASNIYFWQTSDYFAPAAELNPLLHTWSLAVEEQFYIVFPFVLLALWRFGGRAVLWTIVALSLGSLLLAELGSRRYATATFYLIPTRAWELGVGAICALVLRNAPPRASGPLAALGLGLILLSVLAFVPFPSVHALAPVSGTALVILFARAGTFAGRLLSVPLMVGLGLISYSAYLWHQPLFALARIGSPTQPSTGLLLTLVLASLVLAWLSWRLVEQPFRRREAPVLASRGAVFAASAVAAIAFLGLGAYGRASDGRAEAWAEANPDRALVYALREEAMQVHGVYFDDGGCRFNVPNLDGATVASLRACRQRHGPGVAVLGDSHGTDFFNGMDAAYEGAFVFGMTYKGCWMGSRNRCDFDAFASLLRSQPGLFDLVIFHQAGFRYFELTEGAAERELFDLVPEDAALPVEDFRVPGQPIEDGLAYLDEIGKLAPVVWVGPRLEPHIGLNYLLRNGCDYRYQLRPGQAGLFTDLDRRLADAAAAADVPYVSLIDAMHLDMATDFITCDHLYWRDGDHWSREAAEMFVGRFLSRALPALRAELDNGVDVR